MSNYQLTPRLVVSDAAKAIDFYVAVFGGEERGRVVDPNLDGRIVHAEVSFGDVVVMLTEESPEHHNNAPKSLGGSPVLLSLTVDDADAVGKRMTDAGSDVLFPIDDRFYGRREGRLVDPFGHVWIISQVIEDVSPAEIDRRIKQFHGEDG